MAYTPLKEALVAWELAGVEEAEGDAVGARCADEQGAREQNRECCEAVEAVALV
jgi:hypothetical protein